MDLLYTSPITIVFKYHASIFLCVVRLAYLSQQHMSLAIDFAQKVESKTFQVIWQSEHESQHVLPEKSTYFIILAKRQHGCKNNNNNMILER